MKRKKIPAFLCAALLLAAPSVGADEGDILTENSMGSSEGYDYELWMDVGGGEGSMTLGAGGAYSCQWREAQNVLFRTGKKLGSEKTHGELGEIALDYGVEYFPNGNSYLCVYGWSEDPLVEFYIVESWGTWRPPGAESLGTVEVDGGTYDVYETTRHQQPSIQGTQTFQQYWSVRTERKTEGTVSVSEHIRAWEQMGMTLGKMYEVSLCVEGYQSSGGANVFLNSLMVDGVEVSARDETGGTSAPREEEPAEQPASEPEQPVEQPEQPVPSPEAAAGNEGSIGIGVGTALVIAALAAVAVVCVRFFMKRR
ncbi:MAG: glycoside hydrolase family 11 protein [Oscillospiraceae bacterium]|nr:glycoside hydrolase family 11 protein [Oscillospiraceae bacterium]